MFRAFLREMDDYLANATLTIGRRFVPLFLLSQMSCTEKVDKCTSMRGCIIVDDNDEDDYNDGGRKRRATSIEHCLHSIEQIGSAPLLVSRLHA